MTRIVGSISPNKMMDDDKFDFRTVYRSLSSGSFSSDFHLFSLEWLSTGITFKVDGQVVGSMSPPAGGFWQLSGLSGTNPWATGSRMAPFDKNVHMNIR